MRFGIFSAYCKGCFAKRLWQATVYHHPALYHQLHRRGVFYGHYASSRFGCDWLGGACLRDSVGVGWVKL